MRSETNAIAVHNFRDIIHGSPVDGQTCRLFPEHRVGYRFQHLVDNFFGLPTFQTAFFRGTQHVGARRIFAFTGDIHEVIAGVTGAVGEVERRREIPPVILAQREREILGVVVPIIEENIEYAPPQSILDLAFIAGKPARELKKLVVADRGYLKCFIYTVVMLKIRNEFNISCSRGLKNT